MSTKTDNAAIESFNGRFRDECLNVHWFGSLEDAAAKIEAWRQDYNEHHPHRALEGLSPDEYARRAMIKCGAWAFSDHRASEFCGTIRPIGRSRYFSEMKVARMPW